MVVLVCFAWFSEMNCWLWVSYRGFYVRSAPSTIKWEKNQEAFPMLRCCCRVSFHCVLYTCVSKFWFLKECTLEIGFATESVLSGYTGWYYLVCLFYLNLYLIILERRKLLYIDDCPIMNTLIPTPQKEEGKKLYKRKTLCGVSFSRLRKNMILHIPCTFYHSAWFFEWERERESEEDRHKTRLLCVHVQAFIQYFF